MPPLGTPWPRGTDRGGLRPLHLLIVEGGFHLPPILPPRQQKMHGGFSRREQALSTLLNGDPIGVLNHLLLLPPLHLFPLLAWHTKAIFVGGAQNCPVAVVAIGYDLPITPNRPLTLDCSRHPATRSPQLGPLEGLGHVQAGESKIPPWVSSMAKNAMRRGWDTRVGGAFGVPDPGWTSRAFKKRQCPS